MTDATIAPPAHVTIEGWPIKPEYVPLVMSREGGERFWAAAMFADPDECDRRERARLDGFFAEWHRKREERITELILEGLAKPIIRPATD
jgi:hypothetical protein